MGGFLTNILDTAGLRTTEDPIEKEGIRRTLGAMMTADLGIIVIDVVHLIGQLSAGDASGISPLDAYVRSVMGLNHGEKYEWLENGNYVVLVNKIDLVDEKTRQMLTNSLPPTARLLSLETREGFDDVLKDIKTMCGKICGGGAEQESAVITSERQKILVEESLCHLLAILGDAEDAMGDLLSNDDTLVLAAQRLRLACDCLSSVVGNIYTDDVLDVLFATFCIGK